VCSGPAIGKALADQNRKVCIIERDLREPDRIVGEFFQPGGLEQLKELNMARMSDSLLFLFVLNSLFSNI
jgi:squalene monooxygenase